MTNITAEKVVRGTSMCLCEDLPTILLQIFQPLGSGADVSWRLQTLACCGFKFLAGIFALWCTSTVEGGQGDRSYSSMGEYLTHPDMTALRKEPR